MNQQYRIRIAHRPAAVDDFLRAALHLGVAALYRRKIQIGRTLPAAHRRRGAPAQTDQHGGAAQHHQRRAHHHLALLDVAAPQVAETPRDHDGLVIATGHVSLRGAAVRGAAVRFTRALLEDPKIAARVRSPEFVIEGSGAQRGRDHDVERRGNTLRLAEIPFPRLQHARYFQVRYRKARQPSLWLGADPGGAFVANLPARAGGRARKWRDRRGMIVRLHFHQNVDRLGDSGITMRDRIRKKSNGGCALDHRGIVSIGGQHSGGIPGIGRTDHGEQRQRHRRAVHDELRVEYLMPAMLGIRLREHHQLDVGGIPSQFAEGRHQVVDLIVRERQSPLGVGACQLVMAVGSQGDDAQRSRRCAVEQAIRRDRCADPDRFGHPIVQQRPQAPQLLGRQIRPRFDEIQGAPLQASEVLQAADMGNVGGFARPGRDRADPRRDQDLPSAIGAQMRFRTVGQ